MTSTYYLTPNAVAGAPAGSGYSPDGTLPAGAVECTQAEAQNPGAYTITAGAIAPWLPSLAQAQATQIATLSASYAAAVAQPVAYTSKGGVSKDFDADPASVTTLQSALAGYTPAGAVPAGFYWVASDNTQVAFTLADLQGLAQALLAQGWAAFQKLQTLKAQVAAATTVAAVEAVVW